MNEQPTVGRCKDCRFGSKRYPWGNNREERVVCENDKVFSIKGMDVDGAYEWEAAEYHFGLNFGCVHFMPSESEVLK
jgi:hypothetical protein